MTDLTILGPALLSRSLGRLEVLLVVLDAVHLGALSFVHGFSCLGASPLTLGLSRVDLIFFLPVIDFTHSGPPLSTQSSMKLGSFPFLLDHASFGSFLLVRRLLHVDFILLVLSCARPALSTSAPDPANLDPLSPVQSLMRSGPVVSPSGFSSLGSFLLAADFALLEFSLLPQSLAHLEPASLAMDLAVPDSFMLLQSHSCLGFTLLVFGLTWAGSVSFLFALDCATLEFFLFARSFS